MFDMVLAPMQFKTVLGGLTDWQNDGADHNQALESCQKLLRNASAANG
jgi:hypothetical protein